VNPIEYDFSGKNPLPVDNLTNTFLSPKPIISAYPSPLTSARNLGYLSKLLHPPLSIVNPIEYPFSGPNPSPVDNLINTLLPPKATISAFPSPLTSAKNLGNV
jgi:hypothetical protein